MNKRTNISLLLFIISIALFAQNKLEFDGQLSGVFGYSPQSDLALLIGGRYIPELSYKQTIDSSTFWDIEASANISGNWSTLPFDTSNGTYAISPYRLWARYSGAQYEVRLGLQKIDFGSATLLRPLQWFNEIDPRDPLQITNGVYGLLGKYAFLNNANIWAWGLYGNEKTRGFDAIRTNKQQPEFGSRIQLPTKKGEIALSYHHRTADASAQFPNPRLSSIPENRFALDGKWDMKVGLWVELTHIEKSKDIGLLTRQTMLNVGTDYTFGLGNGLNIIAEHLIIAGNSNALNLDNTAQISASVLSYPLGLFDNLSGIVYYNWTAANTTYFLNYQHQFKKLTGFVMAYYSPTIQQGIKENDFANSLSGPGIRLMCVYNH